MKPRNLSRILLLKAEPGASFELCARYPFAELESRGLCEVRTAEPWDLCILAHILWCDVVFVVRGYTPLAALAVRMANRLGRFIVAYWDDNLFEVPRQAPEQPTSYEADDIRNSMVDILRMANILAVANERLIEVLHTRAESNSLGVVLVCPAVGLREEAPEQLSPTDPPIIGYAGNIAHKVQLQEFVIPALVQLRQEEVPFRFQVVGPVVDVPAELRSVTEYHKSMSFEEWLSFRRTLGWAIALAPLPASRFHACKFQAKFLDYTGLGAPGIYSNVPPYSDIIDHGRTGILVGNSPSAWAEAIRELLADCELRQRIVQESWRVISQKHSMDAVCGSYKSELREAFEFRRPPLFADLRALFDAGWWYINSIMRRAIGLVERQWRHAIRFEQG
ncbi:MAG: glycosyltransferase [Anaerolineae bacterium]|nr:glycosyltransferase [Promineifilum sp.]MCZ2112599.1 glycosyltransferase [Anaerolineae bacterium]